MANGAQCVNAQAAPAVTTRNHASVVEEKPLANIAAGSVASKQMLKSPRLPAHRVGSALGACRSSKGGRKTATRRDKAACAAKTSEAKRVEAVKAEPAVIDRLDRYSDM